jgi:SAM-dependent methyltransferase
LIIIIKFKKTLKKILLSCRQYQINKIILYRVNRGSLFKFRGCEFKSTNNEIQILFNLMNSDYLNLESILFGRIIPRIIDLGGSFNDIRIDPSLYVSRAYIKMTKTQSMENSYNVIFRLFVEHDYHIKYPYEFKNIFKQFISVNSNVSDHEFQFLLSLWKNREDLKQIFGNLDLGLLSNLLIWWKDYGANEYNNIDVKIESKFQNTIYQYKNTQELRDTLSLHLLGNLGFEIGPGLQPLKYRSFIKVKFVEKPYFIDQLTSVPPIWPVLSSNLISCDIESSNFLEMLSEELDFISSSHVLEHLHYPLNFIENIANRMRNGSKILFIVPDRDFTFDQGRPKDSFDYYFSGNDDSLKPSTIDNVLRAQKFYEPLQVPDIKLVEELLAKTTHFYSYNLPEFVGLLISQIYHKKINVRISKMYSPFQVGYHGLEFGVILDKVQGNGNETSAFDIFVDYVSFIKNNNVFSEIVRLDDLFDTLEKYCGNKNIFRILNPYSTFEYVLWFLNQDIIERNFENLYSNVNLKYFCENSSNFKGVNRAVYCIKNTYTDTN